MPSGRLCVTCTGCTHISRNLTSRLTAILKASGSQLTHQAVITNFSQSSKLANHGNLHVLIVGYNDVRSDPTIVSLAKKYDVQPTQIILAWHLKRGVVTVPKSSSVQHQKENLAVRSLPSQWYVFIRLTGIPLRSFRPCRRRTSRPSTNLTRIPGSVIRLTSAD